MSKTLSQPASAANAAHLLAWYDRHRRTLPWRALPGERPDPYAVWLSEIMLQQTTVKTVGPYYAAFLARWPAVEALAAAPLDDVLKAWAGLGYYSRARNLHACASAVVARGGFPATVEGLKALPGIGEYTAAAIAAIAFNLPAAVVDGNVERVMTRLLAIETPLPQAKPLIRAEVARLVPHARPGDFAQALMDLGATICAPKKPACALCPWAAPCKARASGTQARYPIKAEKRAGDTRYGAAFVAVREDGAVLVRQRPDKGLLAKMTEVPTHEWQADHTAADDLAHAPMKAAWRKAGSLRHVFTHFPLELSVYRADVALTQHAPQGARWCPPAQLVGEAFPTLFRKVLAAAGVNPRPARP